jgi:hypothetical protein
MDGATEHVRALADRVVDAALELGPLGAALLAGSGARGDADYFSDVDLLLYVDELPPEDRLDRLRDALGGTNPVPIAPPQLVRLEDVHGPVAEAPLGAPRGTPAPGRGAARPLARAGVGVSGRAPPGGDRAPLAFLSALVVRGGDGSARRRALAARHAARGGVQPARRARGAEPRLLRALRAEAVAHPRGEVRARPATACRSRSALWLPPAEAANELGRLVLETGDNVARELPGLELPLRRPPGTRVQPWRTEP